MKALEQLTEEFNEKIQFLEEEGYNDEMIDYIINKDEPKYSYEGR